MKDPGKLPGFFMRWESDKFLRSVCVYKNPYILIQRHDHYKSGSKAVI